MQVGKLLATLLLLFSCLSISWATKGIHEIHEEITYLGPSLYATCSKISGEVIIVYDLQKTESIFIHYLTYLFENHLRSFFDLKGADVSTSEYNTNR